MNNNKENSKENVKKYHSDSKKHGLSAVLSNASTCFLYPFELFKLRMQSKY